MRIWHGLDESFFPFFLFNICLTSLLTGMMKMMDYGSLPKFLIQHTEDHGNERFFKLYMLKVELTFISLGF